MPSASVIFSALALGYRWMGDVASMTEVGTAIAPIAQTAKAAAADGLHCASLIDVHEAQLAAAWAEVVAMHAELRVYRAYSNQPAARRNDLIDQATGYYRARYAEQLEKRPTNPAEAARLALLQQWRPDK
jgi:hypothetical protein